MPKTPKELTSVEVTLEPKEGLKGLVAKASEKLLAEPLRLREGTYVVTLFKGSLADFEDGAEEEDDEDSDD